MADTLTASDLARKLGELPWPRRRENERVVCLWQRDGQQVERAENSPPDGDGWRYIKTIRKQSGGAA